MRLEARRHGVVLARPLGQALVLAAAGAVLVALGWPLTLGGAVALAGAAVVALRAVWAWDRSCIVVTAERLLVVEGTLRRRLSTVPLERIGPVALEQSLLGRLLGFGTVVAGELELRHVPDPAEVCRALEQPASLVAQPRPARTSPGTTRPRV